MGPLPWRQRAPEADRAVSSISLPKARKPFKKKKANISSYLLFNWLDSRLIVKDNPFPDGESQRSKPMCPTAQRRIPSARPTWGRAGWPLLTWGGSGRMLGTLPAPPHPQQLSILGRSSHTWAWKRGGRLWAGRREEPPHCSEKCYRAGLCILKMETALCLCSFEKKRQLLGPEPLILSLEWVSDFDLAR